jgi:hypothetical protein
MEKRGVESALVELEKIFADLADAAGDAVAVQRAEGFESAEDEENQGTLEDFGSRGAFVFHLVA